MSSVLKMPIILENSKKITITLQDPKTNITQTEVSTFTNYVINNAIIRYNGYYPVSAEEGYIYNTNEIPLT